MIKKLFQKQRAIFALDTKDWLILAGGLAVFVVISLWTITKSSIWFDEAFGAYLIRFDFWDIARYTALDVHPPFYYWLLKIWSMLFGTGELALRSMSVLFGGVAVTFGYLLAHRLFGRKAAWLGLLFMILAPMLVRYGQEMRMYTLVTAIAFAATYVLTFAVESKKRVPWIVYGILVGLGMWTHYFAAVVWIAHWAWRAWTLRDKAKRSKKFLSALFSQEWVFAHIIAVGIFVPWIPLLVRQVLDVQINGFWIPAVTPSTLPNFFTNVLFYKDQDTVNSWMTLLLMVILVTVVTLAVRLYRTQNTEQRQAYMLVFALAFVPVMLLFVMSMPPFRSSFIDRYLVPSTLGISLFIGVTLALSQKFLRPLWQRALTVLVASAMLLGVASVYELGNYNKTLHSSNNTQQVIDAIVKTGSETQPIIADSPWLFYEAAFYSSDTHPVYFIDANTEYKYGSLEMLRTNDDNKIKDLAQFTRDNSIVWYIGRPGNNNLTAPNDDWKPLQQITVNDSISNQPSYKAIQYRASN